jgi:hypothetical protein
MSPSSTGLHRSPPAVYGAVLDALDLVLEDGVPRRAVDEASLDVIVHWERTFGHAEAVVAGLRARWPGVSAKDPALVSLVVVARAVAALARDAGLADAIDAGRHPALAALEAALAAALAYARAAHHAELQAALSGSAA